MTLTLAGAPIVVSDFADLTAWTNSWDAKDAVLYTPGATELATYTIDASLRVASIPDNGTEDFPLVRDPDNYYSDIFPGDPIQLPGPLWVPSNPGLYRARPAVEFDVVSPTGGFGGAPIYAMLTPTGHDSADYFNSPDGYAAPYWVALLADGVDARLGSEGAGPTISGFGGAGEWTVGCYGDIGDPGNPEPTEVIHSSRDIDVAGESVFILFYNSGDGYLTETSWLEINYRAANGALTPVRTMGGQNDYGYKELFWGWVDNHHFWSAAGIKVGTPTEAELARVRQWAAMSLPITGSRT